MEETRATTRRGREQEECGDAGRKAGDARGAANLTPAQSDRALRGGAERGGGRKYLCLGCIMMRRTK